MPEPGRYACHNLSLPPFPGEADACWEQAPAGELLETVSGKRPFLATEFRLLRDDAQQAFFLRFLRRNQAARIAEIDGVGDADEPRQEPARRRFVDDAAPREDEAVARFGRRQADVHGELHGDADADSGTVAG